MQISQRKNQQRQFQLFFSSSESNPTTKHKEINRQIEKDLSQFDNRDFKANKKEIT